MDHTNGPEFSPDLIPEPIKPESILDENFYTDVLGRPRTTDEISSNECSYTVPSIDDSLVRLLTYDGWQTDPIRRVADMRVVTVVHDNGPYLILLEDQIKKSDPLH